MKRNFRKAIAFISTLAMTAMLSLPGVAESMPQAKSKVLLENKYDAAVAWKNGAMFVENGSMDSITDKTTLEWVKPDGTVSPFKNAEKFDRIYYSTSYSYYSLSSSYLIVGKDGKKALLQEDGSFVGDKLYDDIRIATNQYMVVKEDGKYAVRKLDSTLVKTYPGDTPISIQELDGSLIVKKNGNVIDIFDKDLNEIDLSGYEWVYIGKSDLYVFANKKQEGVISVSGKEIVPVEYGQVHSFTYKGAKYYEAQDVHELSEGSYLVSSTIYAADGTVVLDLPDGYIDSYDLDQNGGYAILTSGKYGIYDFNTKSIKVEPTYDNIYDNDNHCFAYKQGEKTGVKTYDGQDIVKCGQYDVSGEHVFYSIGDNRIVVNVNPSTDDRKANSQTYILAEDTGKLIAQTNKYNNISRYENGTAEAILYSDDETREYAVLDDNGNEVIPLNDYQSVSRCNDYTKKDTANNLWLVNKNGKLGMLDSKGNAVLEPVYQSLGGLSDHQYHEGFSLFDAAGHQSDALLLLSKQNNKFGLIAVSSVISVTGLSLDKTEESLQVGGTLTLTAKIDPSNAENQKVTWSSSDESVATVKDGVVTALKAGTATITATSEDGGLTATCTITVTDAGNTTTGANSADTTGSADSSQNSTKANPVSQEVKSPATGESPVAGAVIALIIASAAAAGLSIKKKQ